MYNLGTGKGQSVLEVVAAMNRAIGRELPLQFADRRPGDVPILVADVTLATSELGWRARKTLDDMCRDSWNFQLKNPNGYHGEFELLASALASVSTTTTASTST